MEDTTSQQSDNNLTKKQRRELKRQEKMNDLDAAIRREKRRSIIMWSVALIVLVVGVWGMLKLASKPSGTNENEPATAANLAPVESNEWIKGNPNASVTLIEYSDFQCPACGHYYPFVKQLSSDFKDDLRIVYRHYPLTAVHKNALIAAYAAEAAGVQGKFWEMHDQLFDQQARWSTAADPEEAFEGYAQQIGLDVEKFRSDVKSDAVKQGVENDMDSGDRARVTGTPSFFLNGKKITNPSTYDQFALMINTAISEAKTSAKTNINDKVNTNSSTKSPVNP